VRGKLLHPSLGEAPILVTNAHVLATKDIDPAAALRPNKARVSFETGPNATAKLGVDKILFSSPRNQLDVTVATLANVPALTVLDELADELPLIGEAEHHVRVIGHPGGRGLSYSMDDNLLLDHDNIRLHYRAPTEAGSSGSPVFDREWQLLALHHRGLSSMPRLNGGVGAYKANEGISLLEIIAALKTALG